MKVLHLISGRDSGGAKTHVLRLLQQPSMKNITDLCCLGEGPLSTEAQGLGIHTTICSLNLRDSYQQLKALLSQEHYDILHCHGARANLLGALLKEKENCKVITTIHSNHNLDYLGRPFERITKGSLNAIALRKMDALCCVSRAMATKYVRKGFAWKKVYSLYNGTDTPMQERTAEAKAVISIGTMARLDRVKDLTTLIKAFALAQKENPALCLRIAGTGPEEQKLKALARSLGVDAAVEFVGWIQDHKDFYKNIDIFVLPSRSETFPFVLLDAARYGLPIIVTEAGGMPELVQNNHTGLTVPVGNATELAQAIKKLAENSALRIELGLAVQKESCQYTAEQMGRQQCLIYESVLMPSQRPQIMIATACGQGNLGDEAMLQGTLQEIYKINPCACVQVISKNPHQIEKLHFAPATHSYNLLKQYRCMKRTKLFLSGGGNLLQDETSRRSLALYLLQLQMAKKQGCRVQLWGAGIGPLSAWGQNQVRRVLQNSVDNAALREKPSVALAKELGLQTEQCVLMADPALYLENNETNKAENVMFCLKKGQENPITSLAKEYEGVIIGLNQKDGSICLESVGEALEEFSKAKIVFSQRLHGLVLAYKMGAPVVGLGKEVRIQAFCDMIGMPCLDLQTENINQQIDAYIKTPPSYREDTKQKMQDFLQNGIDFLKRELRC